jgi:ABC-type phosphate transport system permease subunit
LRLATFALVLLSSQPSQPEPPIIVKIVEPPGDPTGIADVLIGSLGLTGVITLLAVVLGALLAGVMFWVRSRSDTRGL